MPITPAELTALLRASGILPRGAVTSLAARDNDAFNSSVAHLTLSFSADAPPGLPTQAVLKRNLDADWAVRANAREVAFYRLVAAQGTGLPMILRPLAADHDPATGRSLLLLPDLSATHATPVERARVLALDGVPTDAALDAIVDTLAAFHAHWWEHPALGEPPLRPSGEYGDRATYGRFVATTAAEWATFDAAEGQTLPTLWGRYLADRVPARRRVTLCHGDCYFNAFLCPRDGAGQTYLIDWQSPAADFAALDLNFLFANFWTREQRRAGGREERLLRRYHAALVVGGVADYGWDDLLADYRLMLVFRLFLPVWDAVNGSRRAYWWPKLQCLADAYRDWRCAELLGV